MEKTDTCSLKDRKTMDASTVWKWRIKHVKKYSRHPEPFQYSNEIGLNFNVASEQTKKLNLQLVTNGVILEVCDFAQTVIKSKEHFITNILENNFDLGFENEQQRIDFTAQIVHKVSDVVRELPRDIHEVFALFDTSSKSEHTGHSNNGLNMTSPDTKSFLQEVNDTDACEHEAKFVCSQASSKNYRDTESLLDDMDVAHADDSEQEDESEFSKVQSEKQLKEDLPPSFPYCEEIGLDLDPDSKQILDPGLLTKGVMLELGHFTRVLTSSYSRIIMDVLEHNVEVNLKDQPIRHSVWLKITHLLKRRKQLTTTESQTAPEFKNEVFSFQTDPLKIPGGSALSNMEAPHYQSEEVTITKQSNFKCDQEKKHMETNTLCQHTVLCTSEKNKGDHCHTCAQEESELDSDEITDSGSACNQDHLQNQTNSDIPIEDESSCPVLTVSVTCPSSPPVRSILKPPFAHQPDKTGLSGGREKAQTSLNTLEECDIEGEGIVTEPTLWRLRGNCVEHILSALNKEFGPFRRSKRYGLEFNVGFCSKQNLSVGLLTHSVLLEIAEFALTINSSQQYFIMEILEYNFELGLKSQQHRKYFACEVMRRVWQLKSCKDAVKLSNEVFELPRPMSSINMANQSVGSVSVPELSSTTTKEKCDVVPPCPPGLHAETKTHISHKRVGLNASRKQIGLKLLVDNTQPNKKLDINTLTNAAMTEVTNFAEKLCGTFEQICLDIIRHNFELVLESGDSDHTKNILAQITAAVEHRNWSCSVNSLKHIKIATRAFLKMRKLDGKKTPNLDACSASSSQAAFIQQNVDNSSDTQQNNYLSSVLWKLRANHIQRIISMPHEEHCPLYSYSRCKKIGLDFNVGSGVKQNLDLRLLTNGIMVELITFATALVSAHKYFIAEILEYNFDLCFENELCRIAFAKKIWAKCNALKIKNPKTSHLNMPFELPDMKEPTYDKTIYCPKCYQDRKYMLCEDESDSGSRRHHLQHVFTGKVSAEANCTAQKSAKDLFPAISTIEETMMDSHPLCKKIGLNLFVDKDHPKDKLDTHVLTHGIVKEIFNFATILCGIKSGLIKEVLEHNFNVGMHSGDLYQHQELSTLTAVKDSRLAWFDEVFVREPSTQKQAVHERQLKQTSVMQRSKWKETIEKRKMALQTKDKKARLPSNNSSVIKPKTNPVLKVHLYPICTKIGLDLDVNSNSGEKEKLDLRLLTTAVVLEINKFITSHRVRQYFPVALFDILDHNFDLSSQHYRRWEFSIAAAFKVQALLKQHRPKRIPPDEVFELPFIFPLKEKKSFLERRHESYYKNSSQEEPDDNQNRGSYVQHVRYPSVVTCVNFLSGVQKEETCSHVEDQKPSTDSLTKNVKMNESPVSGGCDSPLHLNIQIKEEEYDPHYEDMKPQLTSGEKYQLHYADVKTESNTEDMDYLVPDESLGFHENADTQDCLQNPTNCNIPRESEPSCLVICAPSTLTTCISTSLPTVSSSLNPLSTSQHDEGGLFGSKGQTQTPRNATNESDMEQDKGRPEDNWISPLESDLDPDEITASHSTGNKYHMQNPTSSTISREAESSCVDTCSPLPTPTHIPSIPPTVISKMDPSFACKSNKRWLSEGEEKAQTERNTVKEYNIQKEEIVKEPNMWELRANRVQQILSAQNKEFCPFEWSRQYGLEFNVGFGPRQNKSGESLSNYLLLKIAKFALAMSSSQQYFIMEILEYNFDLDLQSQQHRKTFACEMMSRVWLLKKCEDPVKLSDEIFRLPGPIPSINMASQSVGSVIPELNSISTEEICDVVPPCPPDSHAETRTHISHKCVGLNGSCEKIGLNLHVNNSQPNKKLDINTLTNGAMLEVTDFAEKLCGTFEQICLDIIRHNFDLDLESGDSDLTKNILARINAAIEQSNLSTVVERHKRTKHARNDILPHKKQDSHFSLNVDACNVGFSKAAILDQNEGSFADIEHQGELHLKVWKLRANQIERILSIPHEEHCPFYSYTRCKKIGLDFNVGSGVKQNLDPKLLTNGVMVELYAFATALASAQKHFMTEILERNFDLNFKNELCRIAFAGQTLLKCGSKTKLKLSSDSPRLKLPFQLPDIKTIQEATEYCPKCYQDRYLKHHLDDSDTGHINYPHPFKMTDKVYGDVNCSAQESTFSTMEEAIIDNYPHCREIGLNLLLDREQPEEKLDTEALTCGIIVEVAHFSQKLCGSPYKVMNELLKHNFSISIESHGLNPARWFHGVISTRHDNPAWFDEVFVIPHYPRRPPAKLKREAAMHGMDWKKTIKRRKLALQTKKERAKIPSHKSLVNSKRKYWKTEYFYPICTKIGLDLDVTLKSGDKEKLDLKQLTRAVVLEIHEFANKDVGQYYSRTVFDILDYNFDLSSVHCKRWEFSIATASKIQSMVNQYFEQPHRADEVFILPFDMDANTSLRLLESGKNNKTLSCSLDRKSRSESDDFQGNCVPYLNSTDISSTLPTMNSSMQPQYASQLEKRLCGDEAHTQTSRIVSDECDLEQEEIEQGKIMWKLHANRVEQILSAQNKEFGSFFRSKRMGIEFNVGSGPRKNRRGDTLTNFLLLDIAKFALAMSSSQQYFIMEILEYNFDLGLQTQQQRCSFACEMMNTVKQLKRCEDVVILSHEIFRLTFPLPLINMASQSVGSVIPELNRVSTEEKGNVAPPCPPDSHAETRTHISHKCVGIHPFCKQIGLNLHVNNSRPNKKLDINTLTNGAMLEVTDFAEKLCGTFEQICLDIIRHNFDLDLESGDSDLTKNILARINAAIEQSNLSTVVERYKKTKHARNDILPHKKQDSHFSLNVDACNVGFSKAAILDQNEGSFADIEHQGELHLKVWKLRANQIERILSIPHEEHCPFYSYTRCKKIGLDFNVGSGVKQNLDPKLLTNGVMVELYAFATALASAQRHFMTEILERNFDLNFKNELCRIAFAEQTMLKCGPKIKLKLSSDSPRLKLPFQLPDIKTIQEATEYCPKCYQDHYLKHHLDDSDTGHINYPHPFKMTDKVYGDVNCSAQASTFSTMEEAIIDNYPHCREIGLNLLLDREQPDEKLDTEALTCGIIVEVAHFSQKLCGSPYKVMNELLKHNFNISMKSQDLRPVLLVQELISTGHDNPSWFDEVFVIPHCPRRPPAKLKRKAAMQGNDLKETIKRRKLALQTKEEKATLPGPRKRAYKSRKICRYLVNCYPICNKLGLDLDVTLKSGDKEKLDLKRLTRSVVLEIHKFASKEAKYYYPRTVFDILDYNFDLSSVHYRRWEFSIATASKIQTMVKQYYEQPHRADEVFKLPFLMDPEVSQSFLESRQNKKRKSSFLDIESGSGSSCQSICSPFLTSPKVSSSLLTVNSNLNPTFERQPDKIGFLRGEKQNKTPRTGSNESDMEQEEMAAEDYYTCPLGDSDLDSDEVTDSENTGNQDHFKNPENCSLSSDISRESESVCLDVHAPFHISTDISPSLSNSNMHLLFASEFDEKQLEQGEMEPGNIMWKLRANRVEQILSAQNKGLGSFCRSKKIGIEFNVGLGPRQNITADSLTYTIQLEIAEFAVAMNSSEQYFIMEILEYNFDLGLQTQQQRNTYACEMMNRVRQLRRCKDAVKLSNEFFELPGSELSGISRKKYDVAPVCPSDSHAETKEHTGILDQSMDIYPFCEKIGLQLQVNHSKSNKKLDINTLTNGAMTEVTNFAEKLCGTFEQICLDIIRHNVDLDFENGESDLTKNILAGIAAAIEQRNISSVPKTNKKIKSTGKGILMVEEQDSGSSQAAINDQNDGSSTDIEHLDEYNLKLWKLRANQIERILSIPHEEHCPFYSYSRCKKSGIDFNVGSGVKQNLDPKLLTNGIMVEFYTFATALASAHKYFITEILEYNFDLCFENELCRSAFTKKIWTKCGSLKIKNARASQLSMPFELPDMTCIQEPTYDKTTYCPRCYQEGYRMLCQNESDTGPMHHPPQHTMTDIISAEANCTAQKSAKDLSPTISTIEEKMMDRYPHSKKNGLNLFVDKDHPKDKLDTCILTLGIIKEVASFAKKLIVPISHTVSVLLKHNFDIGMPIQATDLLMMVMKTKAQNDGKVGWLGEVFTFHPVSHRKPGHVSQLKMNAVNYRSNRRETIQQRKLALQTQEEQAALPSQNVSVEKKAKTNPQSTGICYPFCAKIGLDLDVTSKSGEKEKLDLKLLTRAVAFEIHKFVSNRKGQYFPGILFDILDYNFDLSSQHYRRWEFSLAAAFKVQAFAKQYRTKRDGPDKVFNLPLMFPTKTKPTLPEKEPKQKTKKVSHKGPDKKKKQGSCIRQVRYRSDANCVSFLSGVQTNEEPCSHDENTESSTDSSTQDMQVNDSQVSTGCGSPLQGNIQVKEEEFDLHYVDVKSEPDTDEKYHPPYGDVKMESNTGNVERSVPSEPVGSLGHTLTTMSGSSRKSESENEGAHYYILAEPQQSEGNTMLAVWPNTKSCIKTEPDTANVNCLAPVEVGASQEYSMVIIGQGDESTSIKEEKE